MRTRSFLDARSRSPWPAVLATLMATAGSACGGGQGARAALPSAPTVAPTPTPPPPAPEFFDGWTGQPSAAAIEPPAPLLGARTAVTAAGYLVREAVFDGKPYFLWPERDESYVNEVVYNPYVPGRRLTRWEQGFDLTAAPDLLGSERIRSIIEAAAAEGSQATGLPIRVQESGAVAVVVDPADPRWAAGDAVAYSRLSFRGNALIGARLVFSDLKYLLATGNRVRTNTMLHELGHALGLGHSPDSADVMHVDGYRTDAREFSERERLTLRMMYLRRRPGNRAPDRDASIAAAVPTLTTGLVDCRF